MMGNAIIHRGPDAGGVYLDDKIGFCPREPAVRSFRSRSQKRTIDASQVICQMEPTMKNRAPGYGNLSISSVTKLSSMLLISTAILAFPCIATAQTTFSPEHAEVKAMADKAVGYLRASGDIGEATLSALAIVQYYKRYEGRVPKDDAGVNNTVNRILGMFPEGGNGQIMNQGECYFPALALILLAEVDSVKYKDEIIGLLKMFDERQTSTGAFTYLGQGGTADTSQTQFVALAMWVAKTKEFDINLEVAKDALNWLCTVHGLSLIHI